MIRRLISIGLLALWMGISGAPLVVTARPARSCDLRLRLRRIVCGLLPPAAFQSKFGTIVFDEALQGQLSVCAAVAIAVSYGSRIDLGGTRPQQTGPPRADPVYVTSWGLPFLPCLPFRTRPAFLLLRLVHGLEKHKG